MEVVYKVSVQNDTQSIISECHLRLVFRMELNGVSGYCREYAVG